MSEYKTDPALLEAVGLRMGELRADILGHHNTLQKILLALVEPDAKERARIAQEALAALDASTHRAQPRTAAEILNNAVESGHARN